MGTTTRLQCSSWRRAFVTGEENRLRQHRAWHGINGARATYRRMVIAKRQAQLEALYGTAPTDTHWLARFWSLVLRTVARATPTVIRLERERREMQEIRHARLSRSRYNPLPHQRRRATNQRKAG